MPRKPDGRTLEERTWARIHRGAPDECWEWEGARKEAGYGVLRFGSRTLRVTRVVMDVVDVDPKAVEVLHTCDNPPCCNPAHLRLGSKRDNMADMKAKQRGRKRPSRIADVEASILAAMDQGISQQQIARQYNVSPKTVWRIKTGRK